MKFHVYRSTTGVWRFTNYRNIGGDCDTWWEAYGEALEWAIWQRDREAFWAAIS